jgi:hypothetical protein
MYMYKSPTPEPNEGIGNVLKELAFSFRKELSTEDEVNCKQPQYQSKIFLSNTLNQ